MLNLRARVWVLLLAAGLVLAFGGCEESPKEASYVLSEQNAASIAILTDQLGLDEISAMDILSQLHRAGYQEDIRMAFAGNTAQEYRIWLSSAALSVTLDEQGFVEKIQNGDTVYIVNPPRDAAHEQLEQGGVPTVPSARQDEVVENPVENPENSVDNSNTPVENPKDADQNREEMIPDAGEQVPTPGTEPSTTVLQVSSLTSPIKAGHKATLTARGMAGGEYDISVRYASGESTAQGLEPQRAAADGSLSWTFRVSSRVAAGEYPITLSGEGETVTVTLVVTE
ncbi:MAG: hypothetical protein IJW40_01210 [Clostridia bacterium]|nr:hypothetical protein [Clostridia bacterium]